MGNRRSAPRARETGTAVSSPPLTLGELFSVLNEVFRIREEERPLDEDKKNMEDYLVDTFEQCNEGHDVVAARAASAECACASLSDVAVKQIHLSGSVTEGNYVQLRLPLKESDYDVMFELGPVTVLEHHLDLDDQEPCGGASQPAGPSGQDQAGGPVLVLEPTPRPGFVLLRHRRRPDCGHRGRLTLPGERAVRLMDGFAAALTLGSPDYTGPSAASQIIHDSFRGPRAVDLVACVVCPAWPREEFAARQRPAGWPDAALVERLCGTPIFLVPVGFPGSATERDEWRMSFSRHEYVVFRAMTQEQRACLTVLKFCKAVVGEPAAPLKSYYLKTALLWLCERRAPAQWTRENTLQSLLAVMDYLESCLRRRRLPCYFWPEVDLLASRGQPELEALAAAAAALRALLPAAGLVLVASLQTALGREARRRVLARDVSDEELLAQCDAAALREIGRAGPLPAKKLAKLVRDGLIWSTTFPYDERVSPLALDNLLISAWLG